MIEPKKEGHDRQTNIYGSISGNSIALNKFRIKHTVNRMSYDQRFDLLGGWTQLSSKGA